MHRTHGMDSAPERGFNLLRLGLLAYAAMAFAVALGYFFNA